MPYVSKGGKITQNKAPAPKKPSKSKAAKAPQKQGPLKNGDILVSSWGYDQTNVDFYKVVNSTEKTVTLQGIGRNKENGEAYGNYYATPNEKHQSGKTFRRKVHTYGSEPGVSVSSVEYAGKWDGKPKHGTDYYNKTSKLKKKKGFPKRK